MAKIFISVIEEEQYVAQAISSLLFHLLPSGSFVFHAARIEAGENWLDRIRRELNDASIVLSVLSPESIGNPWIHFEGGAAWLAGKRLIPLCHGIAKNALPYPWSTLQALQIPDEAREMVSGIARAAREVPSIPTLKDLPQIIEEGRSYRQFQKSLELGPKMRDLLK